jgi:CTP-dependent riboflavin kinase
VILKGQVSTGLGDFGNWMSQLKDFYQEKTGTLLYPGTLNITLPQNWNVPKDALRLKGEEYGGSVNVYIVPCYFEGRQAFILRTEKNESGEGGHPPNVIEVASDLNLRKTHRLKDGDWVRVEV